jgi:hypothetical protein
MKTSRKKPVKKLQKSNNGSTVATRLFPVSKNSQGLFVSSANSEEPSKNIILKVREVAIKRNCGLVLHAGWSFRTGVNESKKSICKSISEAIKGTPIKHYVAEIFEVSRDEQKYFIISQHSQKNSKIECLPQQFGQSGEIKEAKYFLRQLEKEVPRNIAKANEHPCLLLICGENNLFNRRNRKNDAPKIEANSVSDKLLSCLTKIQNRRWCIFNPSHKPYKGAKIAYSVMDFHSASSSDKRVWCVISGNNRGRIKLRSRINQPLVWSNGTSNEMQLIFEDHKSSVYMYLFHT